MTREAGAGGGEGGAGARGGRVVEAGQVGDGRGPGHRNTCLQIVISLSYSCLNNLSILDLKCAASLTLIPQT